MCAVFIPSVSTFISSPSVWSCHGAAAQIKGKCSFTFKDFASLLWWKSPPETGSWLEVFWTTLYL